MIFIFKDWNSHLLYLLLMTAIMCLSTNLVPDLQNKQWGAQSRAVVTLHMPELREEKVVVGNNTNSV